MTDQAKLVEELRDAVQAWDRYEPDLSASGLIQQADALAETARPILDLLASKDGELKASEIMRNLLSANLERRTEALVAAEALTLSLRAENERLKAGRDRVGEAAKRRAYVMLEPYLSGFRVCVGFEDRDAASDFQEAISRAALSQSTGDTK